MSNAVVRPAGPQDVPAIIELAYELAVYERAPEEFEMTADQLTAALFGPTPAVFAHVGEIDGQIGGFALWFLNFSTWRGTHGIYLEDLFVRPTLRRSGLGRALLSELARICVERGYARLDWSVLDWNELAHGFYRSIGAEPTDEWTGWRLTDDALARLGGNPAITG